MTDPRDRSLAPHDAAQTQPPRTSSGKQEHAVGWQPQYSTHPSSSSAENIAIPRQILEKIYLSPPTDVQGELRNIFANPTPLGLVGFLVATLPVSLQLMQIAGAGGGGAATANLSLYFGGWLQLLACLLEWALGNTFSFLIFGSFGAAWLALSTVGETQTAFVTGGMANGLSQTEAEAQFFASFAFGLVTFGLLIVTFGFCALRTNMIFVICFATVSFAVFILAASYWALARGQAVVAADMQKAVGAIFFFCCVLAWYLLVANLLEVLEFDYSLPVGDLSGKMKGKRPSYRDRSKSVG